MLLLSLADIFPSKLLDLQIDPVIFKNTMTQINNMCAEAESLSSTTYCESCFACLTAYVAYLCMETYYEKVRLVEGREEGMS